MFGPDKCGANNKVHFIFRHMNPITKKFEEKHLVNPPSVPSGTQTNLYTLIVNPDQTYVIKINNESVSNGSLLENFTPSVNPPETIPDPKETEPADWVNEAEIPDPKAKVNFEFNSRNLRIGTKMHLSKLSTNLPKCQRIG